MKFSYVYFIIGCFFYTSLLQAKTVTTYIVTTQEERQSTRFTLTEWLRIKERMRLMDLWLAMFSKPEKDRFQPELSLYFGKSTGLTLLDGVQQSPQNENADLQALPYSAEIGRGQLWLTNLISGTFGVRTLNIDLGVETFFQQSKADLPEINLLSSYLDNGTTNSMAATRKSFLRYNTLNLRIFGKSIQDSSIILKYGEFNTQREVLKYAKISEKNSFYDKVWGSEVQLYISRWLGLEGSYLQLANAKDSEQVSLTSTMYDYGLYLEISLIRFMGGVFYEAWNYEHVNGSKLHEHNTGRYMGVKIQL